MIAFTFAEMEKELEAIKSMAREFLVSTAPLERAAAALQSIRSARRQATWQISSDAPVQTKPTRGYLASQKGRHEVFGEVSFTWDVTPVRSRKSANEFELTGIASTRIVIRRSDDDRAPLAMFRVEVGETDSPGPHFHSQILGQDGWAGEGRDEMNEIFPSWLKIPRLPFPVATPGFAVEFVLSELFQDDFLRAVTGRQGDVQVWRGIQQERFGRLLRWQEQTVANNSGSPWLALKKARPAPDLFTARR